MLLHRQPERRHSFDVYRRSYSTLCKEPGLCSAPTRVGGRPAAARGHRVKFISLSNDLTLNLHTLIFKQFITVLFCFIHHTLSDKTSRCSLFSDIPEDFEKSCCFSLNWTEINHNNPEEAFRCTNASICRLLWNPSVICYINPSYDRIKLVFWNIFLILFWNVSLKLLCVGPFLFLLL